MDIQEINNSIIQLINDLIADGTLPSRLKTVSLGPATRLNDLGFDSIASVALLSGLMDVTDKYLPDSLFADNPSLQEIAQRISEIHE